MRRRLLLTLAVLVALVAALVVISRPPASDPGPPQASCSTFAGCGTSFHCIYYGYFWGWRCYEW